MSLVIGIDVGGTKIAGALLDTSTEKLSAATTVATSREGADAVLRQIVALVEAICEQARLPIGHLDGVGVGLPATIDYDKGETLLIPNIRGDWWNKPVISILESHLPLPVAMINDARAFTLAEALMGAGRGAPSVACFTLGTGIGGGIAIDGKLHLGLSGSAGEVGHHTIDFNGLPDGSGAPGGFEGYASGPSIAAMGIKAVLHGFNTSLTELVDGDINKITPRTIMQAAEADDSIAQDILQRAGFYLGVGISNVLTILAPHRVVIGGGLAELGDWIMKPIRETVHVYCKVLPLDQLQIVPAELGANAGLIGAALWADQQRTSQA